MSISEISNTRTSVCLALTYRELTRHLHTHSVHFVTITFS